MIDFTSKNYKNAERSLPDAEIALLKEVCEKVKAKIYWIDVLLYDRQLDENKRVFYTTRMYGEKEFGPALSGNLKLFNKPELLLEWLGKCDDLRVR